MRFIEEYKSRNVPRPELRKPQLPPASGTVAEDGFTYYTCAGECGQTKIAALFLPSEIAKPEPVCRVCICEISVNSSKARKHASTATRKSFMDLIERRSSLSPLVFKR